MSISIRLATESDLGRIQEIYRPYVEETVLNSEYRVPSIDELRERFETNTKNFPWVVCEIDGVVAGYAYASRPFRREGYKWTAELSVYTHSDYHGKGIALSLYNSIFELLTLQGYYNVYACVLGGNEKSKRFHEKHGFSTVAVFPNIVHKHNKWIDVTWMLKKLKEELISNPTEPISIWELDKEIIEGIFEKNKGIIKGI